MITTERSLPTSTMNRNRIIRMVMNYRASKILLVAVHYDLFTLIHQGKQSVPQICETLKLDGRATTVLLNSLVSLGFLIKTSTGYENIPSYEEFLVEGNPGYMGNNLKYQEFIWDAWSNLREIIKKGKPEKSLTDWLQKKTFSKEYIKGMSNIAKGPAQEIAQLFDVNGVRKILDVGAGPGTYSLAFLTRYPFLKAFLLDLPSTIKIAQQFVALNSFKDRVYFIEGDYKKLDFGENLFDLVLMSHITHDEGTSVNKLLFKKAYQALRPGGKLIVHDFMTNQANTSPLFAALFSVHMLTYTERGMVYSTNDYRGWLKETGFSKIRRYNIGKGSSNASVALVAARPFH